MDKCKKCGSTNLEVRKSGPHIGLYCKDCGAWNRWLKKEETIPVQEKTEECPYCTAEYIIPIAWNEGCICNWTTPPINYCPVCGKEMKRR